MTVYDNGVYRDATAEELTAQAAQEEYERTRPLAMEEVLALIIPAQINALEVDDQTALRMAAYYPTWESMLGKPAETGFRFSYGGKLYKVLQAHTISAAWVPGEGTESLYTCIDAEHAGTMADPIPYDGNMELTEGLYYSQGGVVYLCTRSTGQAVYSTLAELVGLYVEVVA